MNLSPARLTAAMSAAMQAIAALPDDGDERLRTDTIDGQTDALDLMDRIAEQVIADEALAERARDRAKRLEARADKRREVITRMLEALDLREPVHRALYSASLAWRSKPLVTDATLLPRDFIRDAVDMVKLGKTLHAGEEVAGAVLSNPAPHLTLRTR
jgi:hypothetical protein